jgi:NAD(P)-dependent dehydrogenase (short-subunit alcohol dehydrogenase family)
MAVNVRAPFLLSRALHPSLVLDGGGSIVNIASVHALATSTGAGIYATAKGALVAMTRAMALEWAPSIRVNSVLPGAVDTEMLAQGLARSGHTADDLASRAALGRIAEPNEIARLVRAIVLDGTFMTGASVVVDGGALARLSTE